VRGVVAAVGDKIEVTLQTIGPGQYGTATSSSSVRVLGEAPPAGEPNPGGVRQLYRFEAVASGRASIAIPHGGSPSEAPASPFAITVEVS
jgi:hypothetical protein